MVNTEILYFMSTKINVLLKIVLRDVEGYCNEHKGINNIFFLPKMVMYFLIFLEILKKSQILRTLFIHLRLVMVLTISK